MFVYSKNILFISVKQDRRTKRCVLSPLPELGKKRVSTFGTILICFLFIPLATSSNCFPVNHDLLIMA